MGDIESIIKGRRSIRKFKAGVTDRSLLEKLVELALWAPSSCNRQTVQFRFVSDPDLILKVAKAAFDQPILHQPVTLTVVCVDLGRYRNVTLENNLAPYLDAGLAMQNFLLAASEMDIGSCVIAGRLNQDLIRDVLGLPGNWMIAALIAIGISGELNPPPERDNVARHVVFDGEKVREGQTSYEEYISLRRRWSRAGFNVTWAYRRPKEGVPVFRHAHAELKDRLKPEERCLITNTVMGEFIIDADNVEHMAASDDELWYLRDFLSSGARIVRGSPSGTDDFDREGIYDRIVSPFDVHFMDDREISVFAENAARWLKPAGTLTVVCINRRSMWGLNHSIAKLLGRDLSGLRYFGYETPLSPKQTAKLLGKSFDVASMDTVCFIPPLNIAYLLWKMRLIPLSLSRRFDIFTRVPIIRNFGGVAFIDLKVRARS